MLYSLKDKIKTLIANRNLRSKNIIKNIIMSVLVRAGNILIGLLMIPMMIDYINPLQYGIWLTISSIVTWINFFDIGFGNGLRNKLSNALALHEYDNAQKYVSTTYSVISIISIILLFIFLIVNPLLEWRTILNIPTSVQDNVQLIILIVVISFCIQFVAQLLNTVLTANHEPALVSTIAFLGQLELLIAVLIFKKTIPGSLDTLVYALALIPVLNLLFASVFLYNSRLKGLKPVFNKIEYEYVKNILSIGGAFFIIQIGALILFQTDNIIITRIIGPQAVAEFNIAFKLFSIVTMIFTIIITPYWSAFTDAYAKQDFEWMKSAVKRMRIFWTLLTFIVLPILYLFSDNLYKIWLGNKIVISNDLSLFMAVYIACYTCMQLNCYFLNGIGKIRIQLYLYVVVCFINIPMGIYGAKIFGLSGVVLANIIITVIMCFIFWIQINKIINKKAFGVWNN